MSLLDGLLHWWELNDTSWLDSHGTWNLTNRTAVSINSTGAPDGGPAAVFNGSHYLDRTDVAWDGSGAARSVQIWARYSSLSTTGNWLINQRSAAAGLYQIHLRTADKYERGTFWDASGTYWTAGDTVTSNDTWYHILATTNGTNRHRIYVDGSLDAEDTTVLAGTIPSGALPFAIGVGAWNKGNGSLRHIGLACLAAVWQRELTESEDVQLYNSGSGLRYAALDVTGGSGALIARIRRAHAEIRGMRA